MKRLVDFGPMKTLDFDFERESLAVLNTVQWEDNPDVVEIVKVFSLEKWHECVDLCDKLYESCVSEIHQGEN
jgi:hypothetical protein